MMKRLVQIRTGSDAFRAVFAITAAVVALATAMTALATCWGRPDRLPRTMLIAAEVSSVVGGVFAYWFVASFRAIVGLKDTVERLARIDDLTGLDNRRAFLASAERALERARRNRENLALLILDLDYFKHINDAYGHRIGDLVLVEVADVLARSVRAGVDVVGRLGGEEFAILLPNCDEDAAQRAAEDIRTAVEAARVATPAGEISATVSVGCAAIAFEDSVSAALQQADEALYVAKRGGRNQVALQANGRVEAELARRLDRPRREPTHQALKRSA